MGASWWVDSPVSDGLAGVHAPCTARKVPFHPARRYSAATTRGRRFGLSVRVRSWRTGQHLTRRADRPRLWRSMVKVGRRTHPAHLHDHADLCRNRRAGAAMTAHKFVCARPYCSPAGKRCLETSITPQDCTRGHYCPRGAAVVRPNRPSQRFQVATLDAWQSVLGAASTRGRAVRPLPARASTMLNQPMDCGDDSGKVSLAATRSHQHGGCPM